MRAHVAAWHLEHGRPERAAALHALLPPPGDPRIPRFLTLGMVSVQAGVAADLGDADGAAACHRLLAPHAALHSCGGAGAMATYGSVELFLGVAAVGAGRVDAGVRHLRAAAEADYVAALHPFAALARARLAGVLRARGGPGDEAEATAAAVAADAAAERLGMATLRRRAAGLLAADPGRACGLSRREAEIAALVGRGLTNRQIAAAAHISERTVETHVQHILAKLGFRGRAQIAVWVARGAGAARS